MVVRTLGNKDEVINGFPINIIGREQFLCSTYSQIAGSLAIYSDMALLDSYLIIYLLYCPFGELGSNLLIIQNLLR